MQIDHLIRTSTSIVALTHAMADYSSLAADVGGSLMVPTPEAEAQEPASQATHHHDGIGRGYCCEPSWSGIHCADHSGACDNCVHSLADGSYMGRHYWTCRVVNCSCHRFSDVKSCLLRHDRVTAGAGSSWNLWHLDSCSRCHQRVWRGSGGGSTWHSSTSCPWTWWYSRRLTTSCSW